MRLPSPLSDEVAVLGSEEGESAEVESAEVEEKLPPPSFFREVRGGGCSPPRSNPSPAPSLVERRGLRDLGAADGCGGEEAAREVAEGRRVDAARRARGGERAGASLGVAGAGTALSSRKPEAAK